MILFQILFSPTGGTRQALEALCSSWEGEIREIDLCSREVDVPEDLIHEEDLAVIAAPSYSGRVPAFAAERLKKVFGNGAAAAALAVYGNRAQEDTLVELYDLAEAQGFRVCAGVTAVAEHSITRCIAAGRPDEADCGVLEEMGKACFAAMKARETVPGDALPGNRPYKPGPSGSNCPKATEGCIACGTCRSECPAGAIGEDLTGDPSVCISCMRCIAQCPVNARKLDDATITRIETYLKQVASDRKEPQVFLRG